MEFYTLDNFRPQDLYHAARPNARLSTRKRLCFGDLNAEYQPFRLTFGTIFSASPDTLRHRYYAMNGRSPRISSIFLGLDALATPRLSIVTKSLPISTPSADISPLNDICPEYTPNPFYPLASTLGVYPVLFYLVVSTRLAESLRYSQPGTVDE